MNYVLYNPLSGNGGGGKKIRALRETLSPRESVFRDIRELREDYRELFATLTSEDRLILAGGDGTLHRFVNATVGMHCSAELFLFATGNENRFRRRIPAAGNRPVPIRDRLQRLPSLSVGTQTRCVLNGVGVGLDGYLREQARRRSRVSEEPLHLPSARAFGLLFGAKPFSAEVSIGDVKQSLKQVRALSLTAEGRAENGLSFLLTPTVQRGDAVAAIALCCGERCSRLRLLSEIREGKYPLQSDGVWRTESAEIQVRLSSPQSLAVDGELLYGISSFSMRIASSDREGTSERSL